MSQPKPSFLLLALLVLITVVGQARSSCVNDCVMVAGRSLCFPGFQYNIDNEQDMMCLCKNTTFSNAIDICFKNTGCNTTDVSDFFSNRSSQCNLANNTTTGYVSPWYSYHFGTHIIIGIACASAALGCILIAICIRCCCCRHRPSSVSPVYVSQGKYHQPGTYPVGTEPGQYYVTAAPPPPYAGTNYRPR